MNANKNTYLTRLSAVRSRLDHCPQSAAVDTLRDTLAKIEHSIVDAPEDVDDNIVVCWIGNIAMADNNVFRLRHGQTPTDAELRSMMTYVGGSK